MAQGDLEFRELVCGVQLSIYIWRAGMILTWVDWQHLCTHLE